LFGGHCVRWIHTVDPDAAINFVAPALVLTRTSGVTSTDVSVEVVGRKRVSFALSWAYSTGD
jgi:ribosomal protein S7